MSLHLSHIFFTEARTFISLTLLLRQQFNNPAPRGIVGRNRHPDPIPRPEPDEILNRRAGGVRQDTLFVFQLHPNLGAGKELHYNRIHFHRLASRYETNPFCQLKAASKPTARWP